MIDRDPTGTDRTAERPRDGRAGRGTERSGVVKTGTTTVALRGTDGVVLAADARASLGGRFVANREMRKVEPIGERAAVAFAGGVADAQAFVRRLRSEARLYELEHGREPTVEALATVAGGLVRSGAFPVLELLIGGVDPDGASAVFTVDRGGGVMAAPYAAGGSGMQLAYGALEGDYREDRDVAALRDVAARAVESATERDAASGDGATVATIRAAPETGDAAFDLDRYGSVAEFVAGEEVA
ncbi:proteasome subunit alpha [Salinilacihabitans rarus]|uniref:proteasome subunit alpha n=1 Tax=Salinilacihabitans rarus TaxID=2961596 RepID=UPI0020C86635|nr:proteasome subunit alpha [Salinilacihabitans rarus]